VSFSAIKVSTRSTLCLVFSKHSFTTVYLTCIYPQVEETATNDSDIRALPYVLAIHAFCTVDPTLCAPPSDPSRFAVTLQPYLKTQVCELLSLLLELMRRMFEVLTYLICFFILVEFIGDM